VIQGARGIRSTVCKFQVSGLIILHRNRFLIFGQGRYGGSYKGFLGDFDEGVGPHARVIQWKARIRARLSTE
jgi:hypothetical protein